MGSGQPSIVGANLSPICCVEVCSNGAPAHYTEYTALEDYSALEDSTALEDREDLEIGIRLTVPGI